VNERAGLSSGEDTVNLRKIFKNYKKFLQKELSDDRLNRREIIQITTTITISRNTTATIAPVQ